MRSTFKGNKFIQIIGACVMLLLNINGYAQIKPGIESSTVYLPDLQGKRVGVVANHTSVKGETHLVDFLLSQKINVQTVFAPEHGFRGKADAGAYVKDGVDSKTGLPIISLYGKNKKPFPSQLENLDVIVFDIQDVGVRFYTYISTMSLVMEACAENNLKMIVLDRPNPNGFYIDGPLLDSNFSSFVGMHPVPVVYGMTMGEYALMVNGESWLKNGVKCDLKIIKNEGYTHKSKYQLPIKPSPNLPNMLSIYLYPSLCFFEGTPVSVGRGTDQPFSQFGAPWFKETDYSFTPKPNSGSKSPKFNGEKCNGKLFNEDNSNSTIGTLNLEWLINAYANSPEKDKFFSSFFDKLAGTSKLKEDIKAGKTMMEIRNSWQKELSEFKEIRKKYLLYSDF